MLYLVLSGIVFITVALFAIQNAMTVEVTFLAWTFTTSLVLVIFSCFFAGILIACIWGLKVKAAHYLKDRKTREQIRTLEKEKAAIQEKLEMQMHTERQKAAASSTEFKKPWEN